MEIKSRLLFLSRWSGTSVNDDVIIDTDLSFEAKYRIAQNFGGGKHWRIWRMMVQSPNFTLQF